MYWIQIHLSNCLDGVSCAEKNRCNVAQEQCIGKENAEKFSTKDKKRLCECIVDFYLCTLDTDANKTSCGNNVDSCLTMAIILNGETIRTELSTSTQRSFPTTTNPNFTIEFIQFEAQSSVSELIENIAKNISMLAENDPGERRITIQGRMLKTFLLLLIGAQAVNYSNILTRYLSCNKDERFTIVH